MDEEIKVLNSQENYLKIPLAVVVQTTLCRASIKQIVQCLCGWLLVWIFIDMWQQHVYVLTTVLVQHLGSVVQSPISTNPGLTLNKTYRVNPGLALIGLWTTGPWWHLLLLNNLEGVLQYESDWVVQMMKYYRFEIHHF